MSAPAPASSPRLPSPPPMAEDQISPSAAADEYGKLGHSTDKDASRRIRPGTKSEDMHEGPPLVELQDIDSAFQYTEHLKALHHSYTHPPESPESSVPIDKQIALALAQPPPGVERGIWLYELCRFLTQKANAMVVGLFSDDPPCSAATCPEMRASEWQYLCAAHEPPKSCCAIDYCCHTLDWCATALTSTKLFPSRLALGTENATAQMQIRKMTEVFRRVYRIFAHAWFSHRDVFWKVENKTGVYVFFKTVSDEYHLIPEDNYTVPPEAEGTEYAPEDDSPTTPSIMQREEHEENSRETGIAEPIGNVMLATGNTTRKHRHTMSDRSASVATVIHEEVEEDDDGDQEEHEERTESSLIHIEPVDPDHESELPNEVKSEDPLFLDTTEPPPYQQEHSEAAEEVGKPSLDVEATEHNENSEQAGDDMPVIEPMEPSESAAADEEEAAKSVVD